MKPKRTFLVTLAAVLGCVAIYLSTRLQHAGPRPSETKQDQNSSNPSLKPDIKSASVMRPPTQQPVLAKASVPGGIAPDKEGMAHYLSLFATPIAFYGKVVDEKGNPVEGADVEFSAGDQTNPYGKNSQYFAKSGKGGLFSVSGIHGASLYVEVSKSGYYRTPAFDGHRGSSDGFRYAGDRGYTDPPIPTSDKPAVFFLRNRGQAASLVKVSEGPVMVPKDGSPVKISLQTGEASPHGDLIVESWTQDQTKDARGRYPWLCQVSVPGGGLAKREGEFDFEAPSEGYQTFDEISPSPDRWSSQAERQYFVKTADNHFARVMVRMHVGSAHFVTIGAYYNPTAGDRNLEYDPAKQVSPH